MTATNERHVCLLTLEQAPSSTDPLAQLALRLQLLGLEKSQPWTVSFTSYHPSRKGTSNSRLCIIDSSDDAECLYAATYERGQDFTGPPLLDATEIIRVGKAFRSLMENWANMYKPNSKYRCEGRCGTLTAGLRVAYGVLPVGSRLHLLLEVSSPKEGITPEQFDGHVDVLVQELGWADKEAAKFTDASLRTAMSSARVGPAAASAAANAVRKSDWHCRSMLLVAFLFQINIL